MARKRSTRSEIWRMERAVKLLGEIVDGHRRGVATAEGVALVAQLMAAVALLEHEIGRRLGDKLSEHELAHRGEARLTREADE